jgi:hypothetical protein
VKRLSLIGVVIAAGVLGSLAGCTQVQRFEPILAPIAADGATLTVTPLVSTPEAGPLYEVAFNAGPAAAVSVRVSITAGENASLRVNDDKCAFMLEGGANLGLQCDLGEVPAGKAYVLTVRANDKPSADSIFFRPGSKIPRGTRTP